MKVLIELWTYRYPPGEKAILNYVLIHYLSSACQLMEKLIKVHARHLADIGDIIWDNREGEIAYHLGIHSMCQLEAFVQGFCKSPVHIWLAHISDLSSESSDASSDSDEEEPLDNI